MELVAADSMISRFCTVLISTKYILIDQSEAIWKCLLIKIIENINSSMNRENMWLSKVCFTYSILNYSMHSCKTNHKQTLPRLKLLKWSVTPEYLRYSSPSSWGNVIENSKWSWKLNSLDILVVLISSVFPLLSFQVIQSLLHPFLVFQCIFSSFRVEQLWLLVFLWCWFWLTELGSICSALLLRALLVLRVLFWLGCDRAGCCFPAQSWISQNTGSFFCNLLHLLSANRHL